MAGHFPSCFGRDIYILTPRNPTSGLFFYLYIFIFKEKNGFQKCVQWLCGNNVSILTVCHSS